MGFSVMCDLITLFMSPLLSLTFISVDGFQVHDVANDVILVCDAVSSQHISGLSSDIQGFTAGVPLQHRYHLWSRSVSVVQRVKISSLKIYI